MAELKTQGTSLFLTDTADTANEVRLVGKITSIGEFGGVSGEIDTTNLASTAKEFLAALKDNGSIAIGFNYDPQDESQSTLNALIGGANKRFIIACSEATTAVTFTSVIVVPTDRTTFDFNAAVLGMPKGAAVDGIWAGTLTLRVSGDITEQAAV